LDRFGEGTELHASRYAIPSQVMEKLGEIPWEAVLGMATAISDTNKLRTPYVKKLQKEIELHRLLLMERARLHSKEGKFDPKLFVDSVRLLEKCEKLAHDYDMDLHEFNSFLYLFIQKVKKEKLARHESGRRQISHYTPMDEDEIERLKRKSEKGGPSGRSGGKRY